MNRHVRYLTNRARRNHGLPGLRASALLNRSARAKARRLARTGVLDHGLWWKLIWRVAGRRYGTIGENIARGQDNADRVVSAWMASPAHRENILAGKYTHLGVGHARRGGADYWVQHFGGR